MQKRRGLAGGTDNEARILIFWIPNSKARPWENSDAWKKIKGN